MKVFLGALIFASALPTFAHTAPEIFELASGLSISKCTFFPDHTDCENLGSKFTSVKIPLSICSNAGGRPWCSGSWKTTLPTDGYDFVANLNIIKYTKPDGTIQYELAAAVGTNIDPLLTTHTALRLWLENGKVGDRFLVSSEPVVTKQQGLVVRFVPTLAIGPNSAATSSTSPQPEL